MMLGNMRLRRAAELVGRPGVLIMRFEVKSMKSRRRDYPFIAAVALMLFATFVITGIAYTYEDRPPDWLHAVAHLFDHRQLPSDL